MDETGLEGIRSLWVQLNEYNQEKARHFKRHYQGMTFEQRKAYFERIAKSRTVRVDLARDAGTGHSVGYCVSSISMDKVGEIESIYVEAAYRSKGIGTALITRALAWMESFSVIKKRVSVSYGNEGAWEFYRRFGFYPRMMVLEQKPD
jgi:ribosomal protein S18 acetylase RimI-like enzyme